jgi:hypothetical protein
MTRTTFKKVPFDIELAKKITNKEVKGRIVTRNGREARIVCFDFKRFGRINSLVVLVDCGDRELALAYNDEGKEKDNRYNYYLHLEVPTYHKNYSNFKPCKWQPCLVRYRVDDFWIVRVCNGEIDNDKPVFYAARYNATYDYVLPLSKITERLIGTNKSYEELIQELDAESTATTKNEQQ